MSLITDYLGGEADAFRAHLREEAPPQRRPPSPRSVQEHSRVLQSGARMTRARLVEGLGLTEAEMRALGVEGSR